MSDAQFCPICGAPVAPMARYPRYECATCAAKAVAPVGRPLSFFNVSLSGGFGAEKQQKVGRVLSGEVGIYTGRDPDTVRAADVAFISSERMAQVKSKSSGCRAGLVVEVMSPISCEPSHGAVGRVLYRWREEHVGSRSADTASICVSFGDER